MKIFDFIKSLLPRIDKDSILEDISVTKAELTTGVIPIFQDARLQFKAKGLKSKEALELQKVFQRNYSVKGHDRQENIVGDIAEAFPRVSANLDYIEEQIEDLFSKDILRDGLSARKAVLVRAAEQISFLTRFSVDILNLLMVHEANNAAVELSEGFNGTKRVRDLVEKNIYIFGSLLKVYAQTDKDFKAMIDAMPDTIINDQTTETISGIYKEHELDPMSASMVQGFEGNPIYHIRLVVAEWQANRYKKFADKKKMLELRLLHLKMLNEDKSSEALQREIEYIQGRVDDLEYKMRKMEEA
jgi:hypothetical protein